MSHLLQFLFQSGRTCRLQASLFSIFGLFTATAFLSEAALAQKVDFEDVKVNYTLLPPVSLPADVVAYRTVIAPVTGVHLDTELTDMLRNRIVLEGFKRSNDAPDLEVALLLDEMKIPSIDPSSYVYYMWPAQLKIQTYAGVLLVDSNITIKQQYIKFTPDPRKTKEQFAKEWESNKRLYFSMWEEALINQYIIIVNDLLRQKLSYLTMTSNLKIGIPKNDRKSSFDYESYQKAFDRIKVGLTSRLPENVSTGSSEIKEAIGIWENELTQAEPNKKDARIDRKVSYATHINCAVGYLWIFDFTKAEEHINKAEELKTMFAGGDFKELKNTIQFLKQRYSIHQGWTGTRATEPRKNKSSSIDKNNFLARAKENNEWLKSNPLPDPNKPDINDPRIKLITAGTWKFKRIVQLYPDGTSKAVYELNGIDGEGLLSNKKIRYRFNADGTYTYINPFGEAQSGNKWWLKESNKIVMGWEISDIINLSGETFTYKGGKEGGYQAMFYLIPEL